MSVGSNRALCVEGGRDVVARSVRGQSAFALLFGSCVGFWGQFCSQLCAWRCANSLDLVEGSHSKGRTGARGYER
jgi:hypothetical protein